MYLTPRIVAGVMAAVAFLLTAYRASPAAGQPSNEVQIDATLETHTENPNSASETHGLNRSIFYAAQHAFNKCLEEFKAGNIEDPEAVYRWSLRLMKTHQAADDDRAAPAAGEHRHRMTELAQLVENASKEGRPGLHKLAVKYYRAEAQALLAKASARPDEVAPASHDAAMEVAKDYLTAVLLGNIEAAEKLAAPGSLAASKRLMESFKGLASVKSLRIRGVQVTERETTVQIDEVQLAGRAKEQFSIVLQRKDGRWLVTTFASHKIAAPRNNTAPATTSQPASGTTAARVPDAADPFGSPPDAGPKETKIYILKHAKANQVSMTVTQLSLGGPDLAIAVDERTNRLIIRGPKDRVAEVESLIQELDAPGPERTTERGGGSDLAPPVNFSPRQ